MHYDVKNSDAMLAMRLRTHDLWIQKGVLYATHYNTGTAPHTRQ